MTGSNIAHKDPRKAAVLAKMARLKEAGAAFEAPGGSTSYVNFDGNSGKVTYGRDKALLPYEGQKFVAPAEEFFHGCTNWQQKKPIDRKRAKILDHPVAPQPPEGEALQGELPKPRERDGWAVEIGMKMFGMAGKLDRVEFEFGSSAQGQRGAITTLWSEVYDMFDNEYGQQGFINPVFEITVDSYENTTYDRTIYFPIFEVADWTDGDRLLSEVHPNWREEIGSPLALPGSDDDGDFDPMG